MFESALTKDKKTLAHCKKGNIQLWVDGYSEFDGVLKSYGWNIGLSDMDGSSIYDWKMVRFGDQRHVNDQGAIIYPNLYLDPRGGAITIVAMKMASAAEVARGVSAPGPSLLMHSCRYGGVAGNHLVFNVNPVRSSQTATITNPTNKVTVGAKGGGDIGVVKAEASAQYEHGFQSGSSADTSSGELTDIVVVWAPK